MQQATRTNTQLSTTSKALEDYLPFELLNSSTSLNWPSVIVRHYHSKAFSGYLEVPNTPDNLFILNLSQTNASAKYKQYGLRPINPLSSQGNISCVPNSHKWGAACLKDTEYLHVHILSDAWNKLLEEILQKDSTQVEMQSLCWVEDPFIEDMLLKLFNELTCRGKGSLLYVESITQALVVHIIRHYVKFKEKTQNNNDCLPGFKLKKVLAYIEENLAEEITLQDLSAVIGFSPFHFARLFKATTGLAPYQYITKMRMEHSQRLLLETDLPIIQIGLEVGIENPSHFSSFFKQYTGLTPTLYRKSVG